MPTYSIYSLTIPNGTTADIPTMSGDGSYQGLMTVRGMEYIVSVDIASGVLRVDNLFQSRERARLVVFGALGFLDDTIYLIDTPPAASSQVDNVYKYRFTATGGETTYINNVLIGASDVQFVISGSVITDFTFDFTTNYITFAYPLPASAECEVTILK